MKKKTKKTTRKPREKKEIAVVKQQTYDQNIVANIVLRGDLSGLNDDQLVEYYIDYCRDRSR